MIVAVCHDAGGAEMVSAWLRKEGVEFSATLGGPAKAIFRRKFGEVRTSRGFRNADLVLCGTGSGSLELFAWQLAKVEGVPTVAYVDHWKRYVERFLVEDEFSLPDEVWVTDDHAVEVARRELPPEANVVVKGNPYLEEVVAEVAEVKREYCRARQILYVAEPGRPVPSARELSRIASGAYDFRFRRHPSSWDPPTASLAKDVGWADVVVGWDSMALVAAFYADRRVVSLLPPGEELAVPVEVERLYPYAPAAPAEATS